MFNQKMMTGTSALSVTIVTWWGSRLRRSRMAAREGIDGRSVAPIDRWSSANALRYYDLIAKFTHALYSAPSQNHISELIGLWARVTSVSVVVDGFRGRADTLPLFSPNGTRPCSAGARVDRIHRL